MADRIEYFTWENNTLIFGQVDNFKWETTYRIIRDAAAIVADFDGLSRRSIDEIGKKLKPEDAKEFIKIVFEVNGKIYKETRSKKPMKNITVSDVKRTFDKFNVQVKVKDTH